MGALYLGVIGGYEFMWLQPLAMLCGIIMLSAISHVTLVIQGAPLCCCQKTHLARARLGWLIATIIADVVYCSAQYGLGTDAVQNNLGFFNGGTAQTYTLTGIFTVFSLGLLWMSLGGGKASKVHRARRSKGSSAIVVLAFMAVVVVLAAQGSISWGSFFNGLIPDFSALFKPTASYSDAIAATGENASFWTKYISDSQRNIIIGAFGSAVGINMTFLLPYTLIKRGWTKQHRELSRFDLVLGSLCPS